MKWFRKHVKHGSRLALLALAIQFALSFGHCHAVAAAPTITTSLTQAGLDHDARSPSHRMRQAKPPRRSHRPITIATTPAEACAICAVITLTNNVLFSAPPVLLLPQAVELLYLTTDTEFAHLSSVHPAFQSRAPPAS